MRGLRAHSVKNQKFFSNLNLKLGKIIAKGRREKRRGQAKVCLKPQLNKRVGLKKKGTRGNGLMRNTCAS